MGMEPNSSLLAVKVVVLVLEFSWLETKLLSFSSSSFTNPSLLDKSSSSFTKKIVTRVEANRVCEHRHGKNRHKVLPCIPFLFHSTKTNKTQNFKRQKNFVKKNPKFVPWRRLDVLWLFYYEMEDCNYCLVDEKVRERRIGSMRERERW